MDDSVSLAVGPSRSPRGDGLATSSSRRCISSSFISSLLFSFRVCFFSTTAPARVVLRSDPIAGGLSFHPAHPALFLSIHLSPHDGTCFPQL